MALQHAAAPLQLAQYQACDLGPDGAPVPLGSGSYAAVWRYLDTDDGTEVAIKRIRLTGLLGHEAAAVRKYLQSELMSHHRLHHPHVVKLLDVFVDGGHINLVMELASHGSLFSWVQQRVGPGRAVHAARGDFGVGEPWARWWFQQLVMTMDYFHQKGVAHRDIKLDNTLLQMPAAGRNNNANGADNANGPGNTAQPQQQQQGQQEQRTLLRPVIKVADFGLSKLDAQLAFTKAGTPAYMAPEVVTAKPGVRGYDPVSADVWSAGAMLLVMLLGRYPFEAPTEQEELARSVARPLQLPAHVSPECAQLLEALLHPNPAQRITVEGIKAHPWFLRHLVPGALGMTARYLHAASPCRKTAEQVQAVALQALSIVDEQNAA